MLLIDELINKVKSYNENADIDLIMRAYKMAEEHHKGQKRNSGEDYIIHPLNVSLILADMNMDTATIVAGLLHDVVEDTDVTLEDVKNEFGEEIADLVDGVTKLKKLNYKYTSYYLMGVIYIFVGFLFIQRDLGTAAIFISIYTLILIGFII